MSMMHWFTTRSLRARAALSSACRSMRRYVMGDIRFSVCRMLGVAGLVLACVLAWCVRHDAGLTLDESPQMRYGRRIAAWFLSGFHDRRAVDADHVLAHYGGLFEALAQVAVHFTPSDPVGTRHAASALCAIIGLVATWKMAERMLDPRAALVAAGLLATTPVWIGHGLFNPKDIPFAAAAAWTTYCAQRIASEQAPLSFRLHLACGVALGAALGVRPSGTFLLGYPLAAWLGRAILHLCRPERRGALHLPTLLAELRAFLPRIGVCWLTAWLCMLAAWPWAQVSPLAHTLEGALFTAHSPWNGSMLFDGSVVQSQQLPHSYVPLWFAVTLPETYLLAFGCALACLPSALRRRSHWEGRQLGAAVVVMAALMPVLAAVLVHPTLYDAQRHFLFILPPLAAVSGVCLVRFLIEPSVRLSVRSAVAGALVALAGVIVTDIVRLHPYEYVYFNRSIGGLPGAQARFETEYWGASYAEGMSWLAAQLNTADRSPVRIASCNHDEAIASFLHAHPELAKRVKLETNAAVADFFLATTRYNCHKTEGQVLHVVERMGVPFLYVMQRHALISNGPLVAHHGG
jgi:hypothetical protein